MGALVEFIQQSFFALFLWKHPASFVRPLCPVRYRTHCEFFFTETRMIDLLYVTGSVLFFALMIAYAAACNHLGRTADVDHPREGAR